MFIKVIGSILAWSLVSAAAASDSVTIAFGSCLPQWRPMPVLEAVRNLQPAAFVFTGDNVYADAGPYRDRAEPERIGEAYWALGQNPDFKRLKAEIELYATWDDHDYGADNTGAEYRFKDEAKRAFLEFFEVGPNSPVRHRPGVYSVHYLGEKERRIQLILLDTRSFRGPLEPITRTSSCPSGGLVGTQNTQTTVLGEAQWAWLAEQLQQPAALRLIVSSIQIIADGHCREKWGNFPHERACSIRQAQMAAEPVRGSVPRLRDPDGDSKAPDYYRFSGFPGTTFRRPPSGYSS